MKIFYLILSFVIINVSADYEANYRREVLLANSSIKRASNMNHISVGGNSVANGLEHVIEIMVNDSNVTTYYKDFAKLNFMIAVPDQRYIVDHIPDWQQFDNMKKSIMYQNAVQWQIKYAIGIDYPKVNENQDFGALDLTVLADERRELVVPALRSIIGRVLADPVKDDASCLLRLCRLVGLYMSAQFASSYIRFVEIDTIDITCTLYGFTKKIYRKINGVWEQIREDGTIQTLQEQLK